MGHEGQELVHERHGPFSGLWRAGGTTTEFAIGERIIAAGSDFHTRQLKVAADRNIARDGYGDIGSEQATLTRDN